jgi:hypothetical protein
VADSAPEHVKLACLIARAFYELRKHFAGKDLVACIANAWTLGSLTMQWELCGAADKVFENGKASDRGRNKTRLARRDNTAARRAEWQREYNRIRGISKELPKGRVSHEVACKKVAAAVGRNVRRIKASVKNPTPNRRRKTL